MCNSFCASGNLHKIECDLLAKADFEAEIEDFSINDDHYACIMPIRCLSLKQSNSAGWSAFMEFQGHIDLQMEHHPGMWDYHKEHCAEFLCDTLELGHMFSEEEILEAVYIMYTNSVNMDLGPGKGPLTGFYPLFANMNHDCQCNTKTVKLPDNRLEVRAVRRIPEGQEITTQYVSPEKHTKLRQKMLFKKWFFWCECNRCKDRTESGSFLGAFLCTESKCGGPMVPQNPRDEESDYICLNCEHSFSNKYAQRILKNAESDIRNIVQGLDLLQHLEHWIDLKSTILHPNNYLMISVKRKLGSMYGNCAPYLMKSISIPILERKIQVCHEVYSALDKLDPGPNKWRESMLTEIRKAEIMKKLKMK